MKMFLCVLGVVGTLAAILVLDSSRTGFVQPLAIRFLMVALLVISWTGLVFTLIEKFARIPTNRIEAPNTDESLGQAPKSDETVVAAARPGTKRLVLGLAALCCAVAVWNVLGRAAPHWVEAAIWVGSAGWLATYFVHLVRHRVELTSSLIVWWDHGGTVSRPYSDIADLSVPGANRLVVVFKDGAEVEITSVMGDLKSLLATITYRRLNH